MIGTLGTALGTNLINNVPMAVVLTSSLHGVQTIATPTKGLTTPSGIPTSTDLFCASVMTNDAD